MREKIPKDQLSAAERDEITMRLLAGEDLLNQASSAYARRLLRETAETARQREEQDAWAYIAWAVRDAVGGPLPPGQLQRITVPDKVWQHIEDAGPDFEAYAESVGCGVATFYREDAQKALWSEARYSWGFLRGESDDLDFVLHGQADMAVERAWRTRKDLEHYLALIPWALISVKPWCDLARRAGLANTPERFAAWVSDDAQVRQALHRLRGKTLTALLNFRGSAIENIPPDLVLAALGCAHLDIRPPLPIEGRIVDVLLAIAGDRQLTSQMADLLLELRPDALEAVYGKDVAAEIDAGLGLASGTAAAVVAELILKRVQPAYGLERIRDRATGEFPTVALPYDGLWGRYALVCMRPLLACFCQAGLLTLPPGHAS